MAENRYVIIGNGVAANRAAEVLREGDAEGRITIVSEESFGFYNRHLLPDFIVGKLAEKDLMVYRARHYKEQRIRLRLGQEVVRCDTENSVLYLGHKEKIRYTKLLICSGGRPRIPEVYHAVAPHFLVLKTLAHARGLRAALPNIHRILLVGGDLISVRFAKVLKEIGKEVTFLVEGNAFWPLELTNERQMEFVHVLEKNGYPVFVDDGIRDVEFRDGTYRVCTRGGRELETDMIGAFFGLDPDIEFLFGSGIHVERGVLVDEHLKTNVENVYAAGDCAKIYIPAVKNYWVSIGWPNAERLGEVAARNILGASLSGERAPESVFHYGDIVVNTSWWREF